MPIRRGESFLHQHDLNRRHPHLPAVLRLQGLAADLHVSDPRDAIQEAVAGYLRDVHRLRDVLAPRLDHHFRRVPGGEVHYDGRHVAHERLAADEGEIIHERHGHDGHFLLFHVYKHCEGLLPNSVIPKLVNIPKLIYILPTPAWASCSPSSCAACPDCSAAHLRQCRQSFLSHTPSYS